MIDTTWPTAKDDVYGVGAGSTNEKLNWVVIGKGDSPSIVKNRQFCVGPYYNKNCGHWVMAYKIYKSESCPVCDPHWEGKS